MADPRNYPEFCAMPERVTDMILAERDALKEKVENLTITIRQQTNTVRENVGTIQELRNTEKLRTDGVDSIMQLLRESKKDVGEYQIEKKKLETAVRNLQNRLQQSGMNSMVELEDEEIYIPGPSKQIMDNLIRENSRLRSMHRDGSFSDSEEIIKNRQEMTETLQKMERDLVEQKTVADRAMVDLTKQKETIERLQNTIHDKDTEIQYLHSELIQASQTSDDDLANSERKLMQMLHDTQAQVNQVTTKLQDKEKWTGRALSRSNSTHMNEEMLTLRLENEQLRATIQEATIMNTRWKEYSSVRDNKLKQLENQLNVANSEQQKQATDALANALLEKDMMKKKLVELEEAYKQLEEIWTTKQRQDAMGSEQCCSHEETVSVLKAQIQLCAEDFQAERLDRERAQNKAIELHKQNTELQKQISQLKMYPTPGPRVPLKHSQSATPGPTSMIETSSNIAHRREPLPPNIRPDRLTARRPVCGDKSPNLNLTDNPLLNEELSLPVQVTTDTPLNCGAGGPMLSCPKCEKEYLPEKKDELTEHIQICWQL